MPCRIALAFRFATNPLRYLNWWCTMSLGVSWFLPSRDFQVLRCDAMQIWCCTASSLLNVSPCLAKMLSPSSPPPGPRLCWGPHPGQWTQCPAPGCGPGRPAGQGVSIMTPQPTPTSTRSLFIRVDFQKICAVGGEHCIQSNCLEVCKNYSAMSHVLIWRKISQSSRKSLAAEVEVLRRI